MLQLKIINIVKNYFQRVVNKNFNCLVVWHSSCIIRVLVKKFTGFEVSLD